MTLPACVRCVIDRLDAVPDWIVPFVARLAIASVFWRAGTAKISNWSGTLFLFEDEYKVPLLSPELAAYLATTAELVFPVLLLIGLAGRVSALGLLFMTAIIQLFVYPGAWPTHLLWTAPLLLILLRGPGGASIDAWIAARYQGRTIPRRA